jgi:uncharacterized protein (TIGR02271 family)
MRPPGQPPTNAGRGSTSATGTISEERIPVAQESLSVGKRSVETGRVRVRTTVEEHEALIRDALAREEVEVVRVAIDREVGEAPQVREDGGTTIIPLVDEVIVTSKRLVLREEIHIRRRSTTEQVEQAVTLRSTRAVIERQENEQGNHPTTTLTQE